MPQSDAHAGGSGLRVVSSGVHAVPFAYYKGGGLVCTSNMQIGSYTVGSHHPLVHAHLLERYAQTSGARVYRYEVRSTKQLFPILAMPCQKRACR